MSSGDKSGHSLSSSPASESMEEGRMEERKGRGGLWDVQRKWSGNGLTEDKERIVAHGKDV